jgi:epoxide hydrolase-like predicted phosphatase
MGNPSLQVKLLVLEETGNRLPRTIIFDLGKVLIPFDFSRAYQAIEAACPFPAREIAARIHATGWNRRLETGAVDSEAFVESIARELAIRCSYSEFRAIWNSIFLSETLIPDEMLAGLRRRYRLLLLSNTNAMHFESIQANYPILRHFHDYVLSYRVGMVKPDPAIYRHAASLAGCPVEECLFIDDLPENVAGAELVGMPAIQFSSLDQLERDFTARGIRWD